MHDKGNLRTGLVPVRVGVAEAVYTFMYGGGGSVWFIVCPVLGSSQSLKCLHAKAGILKLVATASMFKGRREGRE